MKICFLLALTAQLDGVQLITRALLSLPRWHPLRQMSMDTIQDGV